MDYFLHYLTLPYLIKGITVTLQITLLGLAGGMLAGFILASMQQSRFRLLSGFARLYAVVFRGTPVILQMVFAYDALPHIGLKLSPIAAAALALSANEAPFISEIFRSGVLSVGKGQTAAGQALGMTPLMLMLRIIAPQAIRNMVPALGSEAVNAMKNSSLAMVISAQELTLRSTQLASSTFDFFSIFFASGVMYLGLTGAISVLQLAIESLLDLDRPTQEGFFARLIPGRYATRQPALASDPSGAPKTKVAADRSTPFVDDPTNPIDEAQPRRSSTLAQRPIAVEIRDLHKRYGEQVIFNGLDFCVRSGEVVALMGPSGSGKSTLLSCINRLEDWDDGMVMIRGRRLGYSTQGKKLTTAELARKRADLGVGMVFQHFNLFSHLSALENIAGPLRWVHGKSREEAQQRAWELLDQVGLADRAQARPHQLSGGQQQRVAIARALAPNPSILLLDEPTSALDPERVDEVLEVIRDLATGSGLTMLISTHQLNFARDVADRVVLMSGGAVVEEGAPGELFKHPKSPITARFFGLEKANANATEETLPG